MTEEQRELEAKILAFRIKLKNIVCVNDIPLLEGKVITDVYDGWFNITELKKHGEVDNLQ